MKKVFMIIAALSGLMACDRTGEAVLQSGNVIDEIVLDAGSGVLPVSVETEGIWTVSVQEDTEWLSVDVEGGSGKGAFTISYDSNLSDASHTTESRVSAVVISTRQGYISDTVRVVQHGLLNSASEVSCVPSDRIVLEYESQEMISREIVFCSAEGLENIDALKAWAAGFDVVACGDKFLVPEQEGNVYTDEEGVNYVTADHTASINDPEAGLSAFKELTDTTYNAVDAGSKWIVGGQLYHYSMMQAGYASSPEWYPTDPMETDFAADRYAWTNMLFDCVWLTYRDYITTWTSPEGNSYMADYVYVSRDVLALVYAVEILERPVAGMKHNPLKVTLKY